MDDLYDLSFLQQEEKDPKFKELTNSIPMNFEDNKRWSYVLLDLTFKYQSFKDGNLNMMSSLLGTLRGLFNEWSYMIKDKKFFKTAFAKAERLIEVGTEIRNSNENNQLTAFGCVMYPIPVPGELEMASKIVDAIHYKLMNLKGIILSRVSKNYTNPKEDQI
jgi:hypothetical protein